MWSLYFFSFFFSFLVFPSSNRIYLKSCSSLILSPKTWKTQQSCPRCYHKPSGLFGGQRSRMTFSEIFVIFIFLQVSVLLIYFFSFQYMFWFLCVYFITSLAKICWGKWVTANMWPNNSVALPYRWFSNTEINNGCLPQIKEFGFSNIQRKLYLLSCLF